jgi:hypothetical protein
VRQDTTTDHGPDHRVQTGAVAAAGQHAEAHLLTLPARGRGSGHRYDDPVLAISGFLEWFFLGLLTMLVAAVSLFGLFAALQLFRNPGRPTRPRR